jgi:hypothetical protein
MAEHVSIYRVEETKQINAVNEALDELRELACRSIVRNYAAAVQRGSLGAIVNELM